MDTKWKKFKRSWITKGIVFVLMVACFTGGIKALIDIVESTNGEMEDVFVEDYFQSQSYIEESDMLINNLTRLLGEYKSEEHILDGGTISAEAMQIRKEDLLYEHYAEFHDPSIDEADYMEQFEQEYAEEIAQAREEMIQDDLREYHSIVQRIEQTGPPLFYATDGENVFTNTTITEKRAFEKHPAFMIFEGYDQSVFPQSTKENESFHWITNYLSSLDPQEMTIYLAFTEQSLNELESDWQEQKELVKDAVYLLAVFLIGFLLTFGYLASVIGKKSEDEAIHFHGLDKLYNDINVGLCFLLIMLWFFLMGIVYKSIDTMLIPVTAPIAAVGLLLILSLVKHVKNKSLFTHMLLYRVFYHIAKFIGAVYLSGGVGIKTVLIVVGYPLLVAVTFFMFPVTIAVAAWFAFKKVKAFRSIQEGVEIVKEGKLHHRIDVDGKGEFARIASNINGITDGLSKAVDSELKSERMKTELITNVSHDIRTPLTSIITYVDLLKREEDPVKKQEYIEVLDQKAKRLQLLTDDLFDAAKASSGNIPVELQQIDVVSLISQGLGEVNDKIEAAELDLKFRHPEDKVYVTADGKLFWRSIENVLSNIFKYSLRGTRVYIDIEDVGDQVCLSFKNIASYELNIPAAELLTRFKRADESRTSQGSGLGLSIAKNLIETQNGRFEIQIDGDLFKAMIYLPKK
ncbi:HAMP domain-containing histidine kinase [Gracilibacillus caseinilyticus]|uniref:histidine kinase n=1 Tax=Gracilibacillus caseinilyticus TaxID=2932256 RepID=A0ABY4EZM0_9BACI|nr:HAMP domain-containing sensor histidine kinase [Gracilibacillus caseinilyticus]UOQ49838.1 HAMP domain-containing histidine kinase [Gracilibacillus caseinilyticus]